jgi:hypothetical protein
LNLELDMNENNDLQRAPAKAVWEAPTIQEIDYAQTEAAYVPGAPNDLGIYTV